MEEVAKLPLPELLPEGLESCFDGVGLQFLQGGHSCHGANGLAGPLRYTPMN